MDHAQEVPAAAGVGDPEVPEKAKRRRFDVAYKLRILEEAARSTGPGELGELLRRAGLYSSHLTTWRRQRDEGSLAGLMPKRRGRKAKRKDAVALENERLRRENERLTQRLKQAETIIDVQKKVSAMLAVSPEELRAPPSENGPSECWLRPKNLVTT